VGLLKEVLLLPLAPVRVAFWAVGKTVEEAEREHYGPAAVRAELARLSEALDEGLVTAEEFDRLEDELLDRLEEGARRGTRD
jgi:hypothetical protein